MEVLLSRKKKVPAINYGVLITPERVDLIHTRVASAAEYLLTAT
jgi:hypothetical protein